MYRVWYSTESFADYIIDKTELSRKQIVKKELKESDANNPNEFYRIPDHIRKILYLDCADLIIEKDNDPILCIEETKEAGTGHNVTQRFARIVAAAENRVPVLYIQPEGTIVSRKAFKTVTGKRVPLRDAAGNPIYKSKWDTINPFIFAVMEEVMNIYNMPALFYYYPTDDIKTYYNNAAAAPHFNEKGICHDVNIAKYAACPDSTSPTMQAMFQVINEIIDLTETYGIADSKNRLLSNPKVQKQRSFMKREFAVKARGVEAREMSPATATVTVPTEYILNYLSQYEDSGYKVGELIKSRENTVIYQVDSTFRGDPYAGNLSAIDCLMCRNGITFEDRKNNLFLAFGTIVVDDKNRTIQVVSAKNTSIDHMFDTVKRAESHNLLVKNYKQLKNHEIPRYMMQVRYGSTYSKVKHIRVFSYFADAILFYDGALWRDA